MFVYCNDKMSILVPHRCGHTNIHHYFGLVPYQYLFPFEAWVNSPRRVVVLRNPLERIVSTNSVPGFYKPWVDFCYHTRPYMHRIEPYTFSVIDFRNLGEYVPLYTDKRQSVTTNTFVDDYDAEKYYVENDEYSLSDLQREVDLYKNYMEFRPRLSVEEWRELTS